MNGDGSILSIVVADQEEKEDGTWYIVDCSFARSRLQAPEKWRAMRSFDEFRSNLNERLQKHLELPIDFPSTASSIPDAAATLNSWCSALAAELNKGEVSDSVVVIVLDFFHAPMAVKSTQALALQLFGKHFDDHFGINSSLIHDALRGSGSSDEQKARCARFPSFKSRPEAWGLKVRILKSFWEYIYDDSAGYASAHYVDESFNHVCLVEPCRWAHKGRRVSRSEARGELTPMRSDMHNVVSRYVKPLTETTDVGASLLLNAGIIAGQRGLNAEDFCMAKVFISHTWNENFTDFVKTIDLSMDENTVIWICSFAIFQHGDIAATLSDIQCCPFATAMMYADRVVAVTDSTAEAFKRCWVVFEADFARQLDKPYDISLPDDADSEIWHKVGVQLSSIDVRECVASREEDKIQILKIADKALGGIDGLNEKVRSISRAAMRRAELMDAVASGELTNFQALDVTNNELQEWRSIRGRSATHVAATKSCISILIEILRRTNNAHLNMLDRDGNTPLSAAVRSGALAAVPALITMKAALDIPLKGGASLVHCAAATGNNKLVSILLESGCTVDTRGDFEGYEACSPLNVAAERGHAGIIYTLVDFEADPESPARHGLRPLHSAAIKGRTEAAMSLLSMTADVNATDQAGRTALMFAALFGRPALVSCLLGAGARTNTMCHRGHDVFHYVDKLANDHSDLAQVVSSLLSVAYKRDRSNAVGSSMELRSPFLRMQW